MTQRRLGWLDALRGYAALVVVCFHLSPSVLGPDRHMAIYRHIDLGKYGVLLFFLVSGYVIPLSLERHGSLRRFFLGRLFRVYPAYLVTIGAAALLGVWHGGVLAHASMLLDPLGQRGAVRVFWTLSYEMIFYLVVAGLFAWRLHRHSAWFAAGLALAALLFGPVLPDGLLGSGPTIAVALLLLMAVSVGGHLARWHRTAGAAGIGFLLVPAVNGHPTAHSTVAGPGQALLLLAVLFAGTVIYRTQHGGLGRLPAAAALGAVAAALVLAQPTRAVWAATVAAVAATFAVAFAARHRAMPRLLRFLGTVSYSLYLSHVLVLLVVLRMLPGLRYRPVGVRLAAGVAVLALALAVAWAAYLLIERPGQRLGRWIATELTGLAIARRLAPIGGARGASRAAHREGRETPGRASRLDTWARPASGDGHGGSYDGGHRAKRGPGAHARGGQGMTVRRIMGTEVEYGISVPGQPGANPMVTSSQVVNAYGARPELNRGGRARWDYEEESPLRDARGFTYSGAAYDPADALADEDLGLANVILTNGARLYVDHAHPEYSTPECTNPLDVVRWDKAGERVMAEASRRAATIPGAHRIQLYKNNTDNKGASYGSHENYLMRRQTPFADIVAHLTPFFVTRQVFCGAGRVGIGQDGSGAGFQISSRADFFEVEVGLETTLKRPIINTRDEPHSDADKYRRLHVIIGDANLSEVATYLKVGTTALVLSMIEDKIFTGELGIADPVSELKSVSHDPSLSHLMRLRDGRRLTALDLQWAYYERARAYVDERYGADVDDQTADVLRRWERVLDRLGHDPMLCSDELDWVAKLRLLGGYRDRENLAWSSPKLQLVDLQYADVRPEKGLYHRLVARGSMKTLLDDAETRRAMVEPPDDTRAYFRGRCLAQYASEVVAASWDSVIFDVGRESLVRVPMMEPERGTRKHVGALFDKCESAKDLLEVITSR